MVAQRTLKETLLYSLRLFLQMYLNEKCRMKETSFEFKVVAAHRSDSERGSGISSYQVDITSSLGLNWNQESFQNHGDVSAGRF